MMILCGIVYLSFLCSCATTVVPQDVSSTQWYTDSSTPKQYQSLNSGFIGFDAEGNGILTADKRARYNRLIELYKDRFAQKAIVLEKDAGIVPIHDFFGNTLFKIDAQHLSYFAELEKLNRKTKL